MERECYINSVKKVVSDVIAHKQKIEKFERYVLTSPEKFIEWLTLMTKTRKVCYEIIGIKYGYDAESLKLVGSRAPAEHELEAFVRGLIEFLNGYWFLCLCLDTALDSFNSAIQAGKSEAGAMATSVRNVFRLRETLPPTPVMKTIFERRLDLRSLQEDLFKTAGWVRTQIKIGGSRKRLTDSLKVRHNGQSEETNFLEILPGAVVVGLSKVEPGRYQTITDSARALVNATTREIENDQPVDCKHNELEAKSQNALKKKLGVQMEDNGLGLGKASRLIKEFEERELARLDLKQLTMAAKFASREIELIELLLQTPDASGKEQAEQMGIDRSTVYVLKKRLKDKVQIHTQKK